MSRLIEPEPEDLNERERWQWAEAKFCDLMVGEYREKLMPGWTERDPHPDTIVGALRCTIHAECWEQMARHLRQPYYVRKEQEAYRTLTQGEVK